MTCTITAEAPELDYFADAVTRKQKILVTILALYRQGYTDFYVNCERGISLWAAEAICHLKKMLSRSDLLLVFGDEAAACSTALCAAKAGIILFPFENHDKNHDFHSRRRQRMGMHETDFVPFYGTKWRVL